MGNREGRRLQGRPLRRLEDNIKVNFKGIGRKNIEWIYLALEISPQEAVVLTATKHEIR